MDEKLSCSLDLRSFQALLNGLTKNLFYGIDSLTTKYLADQLFKSPESLEEFQISNEISSFREILSCAATGNWTVAQLIDHLNSKSLPGDYVQVFSNFWTKESDKIHKHLVKKCTWNNSLSHLSWRVDVKAISKTSAELNEPVVFFEFQTKKGDINDDKPGLENAKFEMNREEVSDIVRELSIINQKFEELR